MVHLPLKNDNSIGTSLSTLSQRADIRKCHELQKVIAG